LRKYNYRTIFLRALLIPILIFLSDSSAISGDLIEVRFSADSQDEIVDFGVVARGDSISIDVTVSNISSSTLYFGENDPYFILSDPIFFPDGIDCSFCNSFYDSNFDLDSLLPGEEASFEIKHVLDNLLGEVADNNVFYANLHITPSLTRELTKVNFDETTERYLLIGRIEERGELAKYIKYDFSRMATDNNPTDTLKFGRNLANGNPVEKIWSIKNLDGNTIRVDDIEFDYISNNLCGNFELLNTYSFPIELGTDKEELDIPIRYNANEFCPGRDTARVVISYSRNSTAQLTDTLILTGSSQTYELELLGYELNGQYISTSSQTVDLDTLAIAGTGEVSAYFRYRGEFEISIDSFTVRDRSGLLAYGGYEQNSFSVSPLSKELQVTFEYLAGDVGEIKDLLFFETDLDDLGFGNYLPADNLSYQITGQVVSPKFEMLIDTIDFGTVIRTGSCDLSADSSLTVINSGNDTLSITIQNSQNNAFLYNREEVQIAPGNSYDLNIAFMPEDNGRYESILNITTNDRQNQFESIRLIGQSSSSSPARVSASNIKAKPGSQIRIPVFISDTQLEFAERFHTLLEFNGSIMDFVAYDTDGTASQNISSESVVGPPIDSSGNTYLPIDLVLSENTTFTRDSVLLNLIFDIYLGDGSSSELRFVKSRFSNQNCNDIISLASETTTVSLDSVLGLNRKTFDKQPYTNDIELTNVFTFDGDLHIHGESEYEQLLAIEIFDLYGRKLVVDTAMANKGKFNIKIDSENEVHIGNMLVTVTSEGGYKSTHRVSGK
jgi:hypothetical protein